MTYHLASNNTDDCTYKWNQAIIDHNGYLDLDPNGTYWTNDTVQFAKFGHIRGHNSGLYVREGFGAKPILSRKSLEHVGHQADKWMEISGLILNGRRGQVPGNDEITGVDFMGSPPTAHARLNVRDVRVLLCETGWNMMNTQYNRLSNLEAALCRDGFRFWNHPVWGGATDQPASQFKPHECDHGFLFLDIARGDAGGLPMNGTVWRDMFPRGSRLNHFVFDSYDRLTGPNITIDGGSSEYHSAVTSQPIERTFTVEGRPDPIKFLWKAAPVYVGTAIVHFVRYHFNDNLPAGSRICLLDEWNSHLTLENCHGGSNNVFLVKQDHNEAKCVYVGDVFTYGILEGLSQFPNGWLPWVHGDDKSALFVGPDQRTPTANPNLGTLLNPTWVPLKPAFTTVGGSAMVTSRGTALRLLAGGVATSKWLRGYDSDSPSIPIKGQPTPTCFNLWLRNDNSEGVRCRMFLEALDGRAYGATVPTKLLPGWNRICIPHNGNRWGDVPDMRFILQSDVPVSLLAGHISYTPGSVFNDHALRAALKGERGE